MKAALALVSATLLAACSSLVSDPCAAGYVMQSGTCVVRVALIDAGRGADASGSDGGVVITDGGSAGRDGGSSDGGVIVADAAIDAAPAPDAPPAPDAFVCALPELTCDGVCVDPQTDPQNCGRCGHVCPTGICEAGACVGAIQGHVVAIGHDYASHDAAMARVLGNAIGLGDAFRVQVGWYRGTATAGVDSGASASAASALAAMGRPHDDVELAGDPTAAQLNALDVLVVEAQTGSGDAAFATGARWQSVIAPWLTRGGVIVVLDGENDVSWQLAQGAGLYTVGAPVSATLAQVDLVDGADAVAQQVPTPYLAMGTSVTFPSAPPAVFATSSGTVVFHLTR